MTSPSPVAYVTLPHGHTHAIDSPGDDVILYGILGLLIFAPLAFGSVEAWSIFAVEAGSVALFLVWGFRQALAGEIRIHWNPLFAPSLGFAVLGILQLAANRTAYRSATSSSLLLYGSYGLLGFLLVQSLRRKRHLENLVLALSIFGSVVALFAVLQDVSSNGKLYWLRTPTNGGWIYGPYVNHNHYAGLMEMLVPIPLVICFSNARLNQKALAAAAAALMGCTIFLSGSRGGMLAMTGELLFIGAVLLRSRRNHKSILPLGAFLFLTVCLLAWLGNAEVFQRILSLHQATHSELSGGVRLAIARDTLGMFSRRPTLGWGLGTFATVYPQFRSFYTNNLVDHAHNDYLELLAETGSLGFAALVWFLIVVFDSGIKKLRKGLDDINALSAIAVLAGITGILIHSFLDFNLQIPANAILFYALCTVAATRHQFGVRYRVTPAVIIQSSPA